MRMKVDKLRHEKQRGRESDVKRSTSIYRGGEQARERPGGGGGVVYFSSGINCDQLRLAMPRSSSSSPEKLMSTRILLRLSFMVSSTRPSVSERLAAPAGGSRGQEVSSSRGELNSGSSLKGVLLKLKPLCSCRCGVRMGLKSSTLRPPSPSGVILHASGALLGVDEAGWLPLIGVLKVSLSGSGSRRGSASCSASWKTEASEAKPESKKVLSGKTRTGSSVEGGTRRCLRLELLVSFRSLPQGSPRTGSSFTSETGVGVTAELRSLLWTLENTPQQLSYLLS